MEFIYSINHEDVVIKHNNEFWTKSGKLLKGKYVEMEYWDFNEERTKKRMGWDLESKNTKYRIKWIGCICPTKEDLLNRKNWKKVALK